MSMAPPTRSDERLYSGFMNHDYVISFEIADADGRRKLVDLCRGPWQGDEITANTWEISNDLSPDEMERAIAALMGADDRVAYYYLTPPMASGKPGVPDAKRLFRVVIG
jgi:hypothetical protein